MLFGFSFLMGLVLLLFGRKLFWIFVGVAGFLYGYQIVSFMLIGQSEWAVFLIACVVGMLGAILALVLQRIVVGIAGFMARGFASSYF